MPPTNPSGFLIHPSQKLHQLYQARNFQGANPEDATILFVGRDPNWAANIDTFPVFEKVTEYLSDGTTFWKKYGIHHPFLLPEYKGDGKRYHRIFSKIGLTPEYADKVSFVELIGLPTTGMSMKNSKQYYSYLVSEENSSHLVELDRILSQTDKLIFIAWGLLKDLSFINQSTGLFRRFAEMDTSGFDIRSLNQSGNIHIHRHFSDAISNDTIGQMSHAINRHIR